MQINIASFIVRAQDGSLDLQATLDAIAPEVVSAVEKHDDALQGVASAVHAVFDQFKGTRLSTDALVSFASLHLQTDTPDAVNEAREKIKDYVKANPSIFSTRRGRGGGVARLSDVTDD